MPDDEFPLCLVPLSAQIPVDKISAVIGSGGKTIKSIIEDTKVENIDIQETGTVLSPSSRTTVPYRTVSYRSSLYLTAL